MQNMRLVPLTEEDMQPYVHKKIVVRIFNKAWHAGMLQEIFIEDGALVIFLNPAIRFGHTELLDPDLPGEVLVRNVDRPIAESLTDNGLRFDLKVAQKIEWPKSEEGVLGIHSLNGIAILSFRACDVFAVDRLLHYKEFWIVDHTNGD